MPTFKHLSVAVAVLSVTACSTPIERRQPNGTFDYVNAKNQAPLVIPNGLNTPKYSKEYEIPSIGDKADATLYGKNLDIRPPLQILPLAEGTHVEEGSSDIKIVVESIKGSADLKQEMLSVIEGFLAKYNYPIASQDKEQGVITTDWIDSSQIIDSPWIAEDKVFTVRQRYQFDVEVRPHGRTGYLKISVLDSQESYNGEEQQILLKGENKDRYAIEMLNRTISFMSVERGNIIRANREAQSQGLAINYVAPATDSDEGVFVVDAPLKRTWDRLTLVLPDVGFNVVDMDSNKGLYYLSFKDNTGFWSSLFGSKKMNLENGNYRMVVTKAANDTEKTEIRFHDNEDKPVDADVLQSVYDNVAEMMTKNRMDN
ncbi:outer membrane protein assembly factor BamC [Shewanella sp.]|uniref:outer membrane protein assembly factor BamC n=1 Tax=Shewanella sp. TaxID=50422 RepID=UPI003A97832D